MLSYSNGNLFDDLSQAYVNPVNCVGIMGKGIALEFKNRYPKYFKYYVKMCNEQHLQKAGDAIIYTNSASPKFIISAATKTNWRNRSNVENINDLLICIKYIILDFDIESIAMPALGCGEGGLYWTQVQPLIEKNLSNLNCKITVYLPR